MLRNPTIYPRWISLDVLSPKIIAGANVNRIRVIIENISDKVAYIGYNKNIGIDECFQIGVGGMMIEDDYQGEIWGFGLAGGTNVIVGEM